MPVSDMAARFAEWLGDMFGGIPVALVALAQGLAQDNRGLLIIFALLALLVYRILRRRQ